MKKKIVIIGGGFGASTIASGFLDRDDVEVSVIVSMVDDGGSTGVLRDELGISPVGDVRNCMLALSPESSLKSAMKQRFEKGSLKGHNFGNLMLAALHQDSDLETSIEECAKLLSMRGSVIPSTLESATLVVKHGDEEIRGEDNIDHAKLNESRKLSIAENVSGNPKAIDAIINADLVVVGPGSIYGSLLANLVIADIKEAITKTKAKLVYNCNPTTTLGHTDGYSVEDFVNEVESYLDRKFDLVTYQNDIEIKNQEIELVKLKNDSDPRIKGGDFLKKDVLTYSPSDSALRSKVTYDAKVIANFILENYE